jgi:hypothetical protein
MLMSLWFKGVAPLRPRPLTRISRNSLFQLLESLSSWRISVETGGCLWNSKALTASNLSTT